MARLRSEVGVGARQRWAVLFCSAMLLAACGDDGDEGGGSGSGGSQNNAGSMATSGNGGRAGGAGGANAGRGGRSGGTGGQTQGQSGTNGGNAGNSGDSGTPQDAGNAGGGGVGGTDDPEPMTTVCKAPVPATDPGNDCPAGDPVPLELELVRGGLTIPLLVTHAPDDASRLFVVQRNGVILILNPENGETIGEFLDMSDAIITGSGIADERGLLGLAFHPDYPADPRFFVGYTSSDNGKNTVSSFEVSAADPNMADPSSEQVLISIDDFASNHNGGMVAFGPDGCLYYGTGDGGSGDDPEQNGQDRNQPLAKLLRFDVDNPMQAAPGNMPGGYMHTWDYGLRNPWRFSFDRDTHDLYIGDVGQNAWEEVNVEPKGTGHKNYGWRVAEGNHCRPGESGCDQTDLANMTGAVDEYPHGSGDNCVVGGYVYRGSAIESLRGWYVYGDNGDGRKIRAFVWDGTGRCNNETLILSQRDSISLAQDITSFGEDNAGELYVTTSDSVFRFAEQ